MRRTKDEIKGVLEKLYTNMVDGESDVIIRDKLDVSLTDLEKLKLDMYENESEKITTKPVEHTYVDYIISQIKNIKDLTDIINEHKGEDSKNVSAAVSAIKVRSDITDKIIEKGQSFGIIHKEASKKEITTGFTVANLSSIELKKQITNEIKVLRNIMSDYGDDENIIDVDPGDIHLGEPNHKLMLEAPKQDEQEKKSKKPNKHVNAKNHKNSGGRFVKKTKMKVI